MTGGGDTDEFEDLPVEAEVTEDDVAGAELEGVDLGRLDAERDDDPTAGASDIGGRAGEQGDDDA